jgi:hypothetical protein
MNVLVVPAAPHDRTDLDARSYGPWDASEYVSPVRCHDDVLDDVSEMRDGRELAAEAVLGSRGFSLADPHGTRPDRR